VQGSDSAKGLRFRIERLGLRVQSSGSRIQGAECRVSIRLQGFGYRVLCFGCGSGWALTWCLASPRTCFGYQIRAFVLVRLQGFGYRLGFRVSGISGLALDGVSRGAFQLPELDVLVSDGHEREPVFECSFRVPVSGIRFGYSLGNSFRVFVSGISFGYQCQLSSFRFGVLGFRGV